MCKKRGERRMGRTEKKFLCNGSKTVAILIKSLGFKLTVEEKETLKSFGEQLQYNTDLSQADSDKCGSETNAWSELTAYFQLKRVQ
jgi:hypothetical protein